MSQVCVPIPPIDQTRTIDVEVVIDGERQRAQYRVETLTWAEEALSRAEALREFIASHGEEWLLVQIGTPTAERMPVMFRLRPLKEIPPPTPYRRCLRTTSRLPFAPSVGSRATPSSTSPGWRWGWRAAC